MRIPLQLRPLLSSLDRCRPAMARALLALLGALTLAPAHAADGDALLRQLLAEHRVPASQVGVYVAPVDGGQPLVSLNERTAFNPASTMKVLTTYAALSNLGPGYRWQTQFAHRGGIVAGTLEGDLIVRGGGDPKLVIEDLDEVVARLRAVGIQRIRGDLLLDDSLYVLGAASVDDFDDDRAQPYNVIPNAVMMNFKSTRFILTPGRDRVRIDTDPPLSGVQIVNYVVPVRGRCRYGADALGVRGDADDTPGPGTITLAGRYSAACGTREVYASVLSHRQFIAALFRGAWEAAGGRWTGEARWVRNVAGTTLLEWSSPRTMLDVVRDVNKQSNNVMARSLLLQNAAVTLRAPVSLAQARNVLVDWLRTRRVEMPGLVVDNGSGLSRDERVCAVGMVNVLRDAAASPVGDDFRESLPQVGIDGTMRRRLRADPIAGNAWIKTGTLHDVKSIAGYVSALSGRRYAVAVFVNGPHAERTAAMQDELLRWIYSNG